MKSINVETLILTHAQQMVCRIDFPLRLQFNSLATRYPCIDSASRHVSGVFAFAFVLERCNVLLLALGQVVEYMFVSHVVCGDGDAYAKTAYARNELWNRIHSSTAIRNEWECLLAAKSFPLCETCNAWCRRHPNWVIGSISIFVSLHTKKIIYEVVLCDRNGNCKATDGDGTWHREWKCVPLMRKSQTKGQPYAYARDARTEEIICFATKSLGFRIHHEPLLNFDWWQFPPFFSLIKYECDELTAKFVRDGTQTT